MVMITVSCDREVRLITSKVTVFWTVIWNEPDPVLPHMSVAVKDSEDVTADRSRMGKFTSVVVVTVPVADLYAF